RFGISAIEPLCEILKQNHREARKAAIQVLSRLNESRDIPRTVLSLSGMTAQQKREVLETLYRILYRDHNVQKLTRYCQDCLSLPDSGGQAGARAVLNALPRKMLLRPGQKSGMEKSEELLKPAMPIAADIPPEEHLRPAKPPDPPGDKTKPPH